MPFFTAVYNLFDGEVSMAVVADSHEDALSMALEWLNEHEDCGIIDESRLMILPLPSPPVSGVWWSDIIRDLDEAVLCTMCSDGFIAEDGHSCEFCQGGQNRYCPLCEKYCARP